MADFPLVGVREFREKVATYKEPVTVIHTRGQVKVLGTWYPVGSKPEPEPDYQDELEEAWEAGRMSG